MKFLKVTIYSMIVLVLVFVSDILLPNNLTTISFASLDTQEARQIFILDTLKRYSPTGYYIVNAVDNTNPPRGMTWNKYNFAFLDTNKELELIRELNTVVHETNHVYTDRMACVIKNRSLYGIWYAYYTGKETYPMMITKTFPAREIASRIPEPLRELRYKIYIDNPSIYQSTQKYGIFGLLDEFNSYYQGVQTAYDLLPWFNESDRLDWPAAKVFLHLVHDDYLAHAEFKLYILCYLRYAQQKHPGIYKKIMKNQEFKHIFTAIDQNWSKLLTDYFSNFDSRLQFLESRGIKGSIWSKNYMFLNPNSEYSFGMNFLSQREEYTKFQEEINKPDYQEILKELQTMDNFND